MKLRSGKVIRPLSSSPRIAPQVHDDVSGTSNVVTPLTTSTKQTCRRSPRNKPCVPSTRSSSTHNMRLRPRK